MSEELKVDVGDWIVDKNGNVRQITHDDMQDLPYEDIVRVAEPHEIQRTIYNIMTLQARKMTEDEKSRARKNLRSINMQVIEAPVGSLVIPPEKFEALKTIMTCAISNCPDNSVIDLNKARKDLNIDELLNR